MMDSQPPQFDQYTKDSFSAKTSTGYEITHDIYRRGEDSFRRVCVIIQELPGLGQSTLELAEAFHDRQYHVVLPHLFGPLGRKSPLNLFRVLFCLKKEFHTFAANRSSPIVDWLKALCRSMRDQYKVDGVAVIGMCLTGNFAMNLIADESVLAAVGSQPSLPLTKQSAIHMSPEEIQQTCAALDAKGPMMCGRFTTDKWCREPKFDAIEAAFNQSGKARIRLHSLTPVTDQPHSILTEDYAANKPHSESFLNEVFRYFDERLPITP